MTVAQLEQLSVRLQCYLVTSVGLEFVFVQKHTLKTIITIHT